MSVVDKVKQLLMYLANNLPMSVEEFDKLLSDVGCVRVEIDHGDYVSDVINEECLDEDEDEDEEEYCEVYSITRYKLAWLGLECGEHKVVAVLRNLIVVEMNGVLHTIAHYELLNVLANEKLYEIVKNLTVAREISRRELMELITTASDVAPLIMKAFASLAMLGVALNTIKKALEEGAK